MCLSTVKAEYVASAEVIRLCDRLEICTRSITVEINVKVQHFRKILYKKCWGWILLKTPCIYSKQKGAVCIFLYYQTGHTKNKYFLSTSSNNLLTKNIASQHKLR